MNMTYTIGGINPVTLYLTVQAKPIYMKRSKARKLEKL